ncbi:hypothetical protein YC2023_069205 [Brassica napus]
MASSSIANSLGKRKPEDDLDTEPVLRRHKSEAKETRSESQVELLETKSDESALNSAMETIEGLDEDPDFVEEAAGPPNKKLFLDKLSSETEISDVIDFFKDVGQVVGVRLMLNHKGGRVDKRVGRRVENRLGLGFVEFASSDEAKKALKMKTGEYWSRNKVFLKVAAISLPPKYCVDNNVCIDFFKDVGGVSYVRLIGDHTGKHVGYGFVDFASVNDANKALQQKNGEYLHDIKIFLELANNGATIDFFKDAGEVVRVRLILDQYGEHAGCGFVEFASSNEANKALQQKNGEYLHNSSIFLDVANNEFAENLPPKHCIDHKVCIKFFRNVGDVVSVRLIVNRECKHVGYGFIEFASPYEAQEALKMVNGAYMDDHKIIIDFFKDVGQVVHVRLICNLMGNHVGTGFVEFASADEAKKALEKKNGEHFHRRKIFLDVPKKAQGRFKYCIDHKVCSKIFKDVVQVVRVRLIVDHCGEHVNCGFVEFASANEAQKALRHRKRRCKLIFYEAEIAATYPFRHKYNFEQKLWYEDKLRREYLKTSPNLKIAFTDK